MLIIMTILVISGCASPGAERGPDAESASERIAGMIFSENSTIYTIDPAHAEARFLIDEILYGEEKTVVGKTDQLSGQIAINFADLTTAAAGPMQVNANTLVTDSGFRDRAIQNRILLAGIYESITFTPTAIVGLPARVEIGESVGFEIEGELMITTISKPVTFVVIAVPLSESKLEVSAIASINRNDFDLVVPSATGVAAVAEEIFLEISFVAEAAE